MIFFNTGFSFSFKDVWGNGEEHKGKGYINSHHHSSSSVFSPVHQGSVNSLLCHCSHMKNRSINLDNSSLRQIILRIKDVYSSFILKLWLLPDFIYPSTFPNPLSLQLGKLEHHLVNSALLGTWIIQISSHIILSFTRSCQSRPQLGAARVLINVC